MSAKKNVKGAPRPTSRETLSIAVETQMARTEKREKTLRLPGEGSMLRNTAPTSFKTTLNSS